MLKWLQGFWKPTGSRPTRTPEATSGKGGPRSASTTGPFIKNSELRVSVGLDFGTHSTKVVFVQLGANRVYRPMRFNHGLSHWPDFTLPAVGLIRNGALLWGAEAARLVEHEPWDTGIRRLKVLVASEGDREFQDSALLAAFAQEVENARLDSAVWTPPHIASVAIALQLREVHQSLAQQFPKRRLDVQFALPVPIDQIENSRTWEVFRRVASVAEQLIGEDGVLELAGDDLVPRAAELFRNSDFPEAGRRRINLFPEGQAQMASYLTSLETDNGVHAVVDIGAGTTDISIFDLRSNLLSGEQMSLWYAASAIPKATAYVQQEALRAGVASRHSEAEVMQILVQRPDAVEAALEGIRHDTFPTWVDAYRHRQGSSYWDGCPVFVCGGGAALPRAKEVFTRSYVKQWNPHKLKILPSPEKYRGDGVPFTRMSVAYGLAIPGPEHPSAVLPKDSPNTTPPILVKRPEDTGGDQIIPNQGWLGRFRRR